MTEASLILVVESKITEPFILAGLVNIAPNRRTNIPIGKLSRDNQLKVLACIQASVEQKHIVVVEGSELLAAVRVPHVNKIAADGPGRKAGSPPVSQMNAGAVLIDTGLRPALEPAVGVLSDADRKAGAAAAAAVEAVQQHAEAAAKLVAEAVEAQKLAEQAAAVEAQKLAEQAAAVEAQKLAEQAAAVEAQKLAEQAAAAKLAADIAAQPLPEPLPTPPVPPAPASGVNDL